VGYIRHHAIVVTGLQYDDLPQDFPMVSDARAAAIEAGCSLVTEVVGPGLNGTASFLVAPDGSKEGWNESDQGDTARGRLIAWLRDEAHSGYFDWAEVVLGPDDHEAVVERSAWEAPRGQ
jgi:hypothetical protein